MIAFLSSAFRFIWRKITPTNALRHASGDIELMFMESVYRLTYFLGLSFVDGDSVPYLIYRIIVQLLIAAFGVAEAWFVSEFQNLEMDTVIASFSVVAMHAIALYKIKNIMDHGDVYRKLTESMESLDRSTENRRRLVNHWAGVQNSFLIGLLTLGNLALLAWHIYPLIDDEEYNLMVVIYLPFRYTTPIRYVITYVIIGTTFIYFSHWVMISDLTLQAYLLTLVCQLTVLCDCFQNIVKDCSDGLEDNYHTLSKNKVFSERYQKRMAFLIKKHNKILNSIMGIRASLSYPLLCQLGCSGMLICTVGYQAVSSDIMANVFKFMMSMFYLGYNLFQLYIICRWCEEITNQSVNVGKAVYSSGWEMGVFSIPGARTSIMMVIARANKPLVFSAGGMYNMSLMAFMNLVKTSYSALTMLLRIHRN